MVVLFVAKIFARQSRTTVRSLDQKTPRLDYEHQAVPKAMYVSAAPKANYLSLPAYFGLLLWPKTRWAAL
jgi:hypothetical protein